jgi:DNA polymerase-4
VVRTEASILHLDLDAFYASVEQLDDPTLRGQPVIVGGLGPRGVVAAASYEARRFGVFSAIPMGRARRACPRGVFLSPRFERYGELSSEVMTILRAVTPLVEPLALDEAFLDVAGARRMHGSGEQIAAGLRARIKDETGLVASVGVATTKLVAKLASDLSKPDGLMVVEPGTELELLHPLPVGRLWGVGPATARRLERLGVTTIGDLAAQREDLLVDALGQAQGRHLFALAWNRDDRDVDPNREMKSIGHEETFPRDVRDRAVLERELRRMAERVGERLRRAHRVGRTVQLKLRYSDFRTITRSRTLPEATDIAGEIASVGLALLASVDLGDGLRLLGVSMQQLEQSSAVQEQLPLDSDDTDATSDGERARQRAVEVSADKVRDRFGATSVTRGRGGASED